MNLETLQFIESTGLAWLGKPFDIDAIHLTIADGLNGVTVNEQGKPVFPWTYGLVAAQGFAVESDAVGRTIDRGSAIPCSV